MNVTLKGDVLTVVMQVRPDSTTLSKSTGKTYTLGGDRIKVAGPHGEFTVALNVYQLPSDRTGA